jgi:hypothetical protein
VGEGGELREVVREIRRLGGRRAAYMRARIGDNGEGGWLDVHVTAKDGFVYMLLFMGRGDRRAEHEPLRAHIRDSFAFPAEP